MSEPVIRDAFTSQIYDSIQKLIFFGTIGLIIFILVKLPSLKNKKVSAVIISIIALITTSVCVWFYCSIFFFYGFFNPAIFIGTLPILRLRAVVNGDKHKLIKKIWLIIAWGLHILLTVIIFCLYWLG